MARAHEGRLRIPKDQHKWTPMEDVVLETLVGKVSYRQIALKLGRSPQAVQRRASNKGLSARKSWAVDKRTRREQLDTLNVRNLCLSDSDLADYL